MSYEEYNFNLDPGMFDYSLTSGLNYAPGISGSNLGFDMGGGYGFYGPSQLDMSGFYADNAADYFGMPLGSMDFMSTQVPYFHETPGAYGGDYGFYSGIDAPTGVMPLAAFGDGSNGVPASFPESMYGGNESTEEETGTDGRSKPWIKGVKNSDIIKGGIGAGTFLLSDILKNRNNDKAMKKWMDMQRQLRGEANAERAAYLNEFHTPGSRTGARTDAQRGDYRAQLDKMHGHSVKYADGGLASLGKLIQRKAGKQGPNPITWLGNILAGGEFPDMPSIEPAVVMGDEQPAPNPGITGYVSGAPTERRMRDLGLAKGGLSQLVRGKGDGQSDEIPAMLSDGEYVFDADTVAALGNGSNEAGAKALDQMRMNIRSHKRGASPKSIPPKAKKPEKYMTKGAK